MSLNRRNLIGLILLLVAAVCWTYGQQVLTGNGWGEAVATTVEMPLTTWPQEHWRDETLYPNNTTFAPTEPAVSAYDEWSSVPLGTEPGETPDRREEKLIGTVLSFAAAAFAITAIFVFWQKTPLFGPDGICVILALSATTGYLVQNTQFILLSTEFRESAVTAYRIVTAWIVLVGIRELFGWLRARFSLSWCMAQRVAQRFKKPQTSLLMLVGWTVTLLVVFFWLVMADAYAYTGFMTAFYGYLAAALLGSLCLWRYGADLNHFKDQLDSFQQGKVIHVGNGMFAQTEAQLLDVQAQHEEAVRTAVTSERFKVELIANVSHDLRTPLTSILGYSELLQKEHLSPEGQEQLQWLHQKAGYMNDLVESLFELTKVSSGAVESKKEEIDLIRLLEQTVGLFDDRLAQTGLTVKRKYVSASVPVVTDGARMHQVFANLLGNAIKYALAGTRIYLEVKEKENSYLVRMINTASYEMDFDPDRIMERFARADQARSTKGSGLGLAIAQTYTESVGGSFRIAVDADQFSAIVELPKTERNL